MNYIKLSKGLQIQNAGLKPPMPGHHKVHPVPMVLEELASKYANLRSALDHVDLSGIKSKQS